MATVICPHPLTSPQECEPALRRFLEPETVWLPEDQVARRPWQGTIVALLRLLRPQQWTKNGICFAGVIFSGRFTDPLAWAAAAATFLVFCLASSAVYCLNDILDRHRDRTHPRKRLRPIASGAVSLPLAAGLGVVLGAAASLAAGRLGWPALVCVLLFLANHVAYCVWLKHLALVDVLSITLGFILRLAAGVYVLRELPTTWIVLCSFFLAAFLGFSKRRAELGTLLVDERRHRRPVLLKYSEEYLNSLINGAASMAVMSYALFTTASGKNPSLVATLPIVYYAIMHYKQQVMMLCSGEEPESMLWRNPRIPVCILLWLLLYLGIWQGDVHLFR